MIEFDTTALEGGGESQARLAFSQRRGTILIGRQSTGLT